MPQTGGLSHVSGRLEEPGNISLSQGRDGRLPAFLTAGGSGHPDSAGERLGLNTACSVYLWGELRGMMTSRLAALKHGPERGACGCPRSSRSSRRRWTLRLAYVPSFHARFWTSCPVTRGPIDVKCVICVTVSCQQFRGAVSGQVPPRCHHRDAPSTSSAKWEIAEPDSFHSGRKQVSNLSHRTADRAGVRLSVLSGPRIRSFHRQGTEHPSPRTSKSTNEGRVRSRIIWVLPDHRRPALADRLDIGQGPIELPSAEGRLCWDRSGWFLLRTTGPESCNRIVSR